MSILPMPSINALLNKTANTVKIWRSQVSQPLTSQPNGNNTVDRSTVNSDNNDAISSSNYKKSVSYRRHAPHYVLKGLGYLPTPLLDSISKILRGATAKQYEHVDAHLLLIIALSNKLKRPLDIDKMIALRHKFSADAVAMQAPQVWQSLTGVTKRLAKDRADVRWHDELIADADGGDMTLRCYQSFKQNDEPQNCQNSQNPDQTVMLFFHGGGFCIGDINSHHEFCHAVCAQTGWPVVSVDYRLAPEYPAPTALRDCLTAYAWLAKHSHELGALPSRIVLAGDSAGGCLAISVAQQVSAPDAAQWSNLGFDKENINQMLQDLPRPLAQLPLYPVTDIDTDYPSWSLYGKGLLLDYNDIEVFNNAYMQGSALAQSQPHALLSPMHGNSAKLCPSYIVAAELDILRDEALAYAEQLRDKGIEVKTHTVLGAPHGFIHLMSIHKGLGDETDYIIDGFGGFVRQLLARESDEPDLRARA